MEERIIECVNKWHHREVRGENLYLINGVIVEVDMKMNILEGEERIRSVHQDYSMAFRNACYANFLKEEPHVAIKYRGRAKVILSKSCMCTSWNGEK